MPKDKEHLDASMLQVVFKLYHEPERPRWCTCWASPGSWPSVDRREQCWGYHETIYEQHNLICWGRSISKKEDAIHVTCPNSSHAPDGRAGAWPIPYPIDLLSSRTQWMLAFKNASRAMKTSAGMDRNSDFEAKVDVLLAWLRKGFEKRESGEFAQWSQGSWWLEDRSRQLETCQFNTVNVNVGWCKPWMKRQITFCWLQVIGWASMSTWDFTRRLANVQPPTWVGYWRGERWMKKLAPMGFPDRTTICCRRLSDGSRCFERSARNLARFVKWWM